MPENVTFSFIICLLSLVLEEELHELAALFAEDTLGGDGLGMQGAGSIFAIAALGVRTAVDNARHLRPA